MISPKDEIKARLNIVDLIGSYVRLDKAGAHFKGLCPFHRERTPSFMVNEERQMWHCFGCNKGGDAFAFVMEMEGMGFREALELLAERAGVVLPKGSEFRTDEPKENKERLTALLERATQFYEKQLWEGEGAKRVLPYLRARGLSDETLRHFRIGYAPLGWRFVHDFLSASHFSPEEIERAGMILRREKGDGYYDRFRDRIMFPITDVLGRVIGYSARVAPGGDEAQAKYINTPETLLYHKSRVLYGLSFAKQAIKDKGATIIVEGNVDVLACHQAGFENTVAVSGTALTDEQLAMLRRYGKALLLFFDMDEAGQKAAKRSVELSLEREMEVSIIAIAGGKDAAELAEKHPEALREAVEHPTPALEYFLLQAIQKYGAETAQGKRFIADEYVPLLSHARHPVERMHYTKRLAETLKMEEKSLSSVVHRATQDREKDAQGIDQSPDRLGKETREPTYFSSRSERLREELVGLMLAFPLVRASILTAIKTVPANPLEKHPLFFFLLQAGERDPMGLIEEISLKGEASRLSFQAIDSPDFSGLSDTEREKKAEELSHIYMNDLLLELQGKGRLKEIEEALKKAKQSGNKDLEQSLLREFLRLSQGKP